MFVEPDWNAPIDFDARLAATPDSATVRGMFLQLLLQGLDPEVAATVQNRRYIAFKSYPMRTYVELLALSCKNTSSRLPPAERVRRLGQAVYPSYADTLTGIAIFAIAGRNFRRVLELCPVAYRVGVGTAVVTIRSISDEHALVELRNVWNLPDFHQVGIFEGAMHVCNVRGSILVRSLGFDAVDFEITWSDAPDASRTNATT